MLNQGLVRRLCRRHLPSLLSIADALAEEDAAAASWLCLAALCICSRVLMIGRKLSGTAFLTPLPLLLLFFRTIRLLLRMASSDIS
jgi:hypothetical protein